MTPEEYNWETWFITHRDLMCHRFTPRVEMRTNIKTGYIQIFKNEKEISHIDGSEMLISEYEQLLVRTAKEAAMLPSINNQ